MEEERQAAALKSLILYVRYCGGVSQKDLRKNKFTNKTMFQTEGQLKNDRHILDLELAATIVNLLLIMENRTEIPLQDMSNLRNALMNGSINLHQHASRRANVGETTTRKDGSIHTASEKVSDLSTSKLIFDSFWSGKFVRLSSFGASHVKLQVGVLKSPEVRSSFSDPSAYLRMIAWYLKITEKVLGPEDSVRHSPDCVVTKSMFDDILDSDEGRTALSDVDNEFKTLVNFLDYLVNEEAKASDKSFAMQDLEAAEELAQVKQAADDAHLAQLKEVLRIRLENGESGVLENDGGDNDTVECIESTLEALDLVREFEALLDDTIAEKQHEVSRMKMKLKEAQERYERIQRINAERARAIEASRAQLALDRARAQQQSRSQARPYYSSSYSSYYVIPTPTYSTPMIQTHDGCLFPVGTSVSTIRNCLISMGTFESGHGAIADCPIVDTSERYY